MSSVSHLHALTNEFAQRALDLGSCPLWGRRSLFAWVFLGGSCEHHQRQCETKQCETRQCETTENPRCSVNIFCMAAIFDFLICNAIYPQGLARRARGGKETNRNATQRLAIDFLLLRVTQISWFSVGCHLKSCLIDGHVAKPSYVCEVQTPIKAYTLFQSKSKHLALPDSHLHLVLARLCHIRLDAFPPCHEPICHQAPFETVMHPHYPQTIASCPIPSVGL